VFRLKMKGVKLSNTEGFMRKSDPFYELSRKVDAAGAATWDVVHRSNTVMNNLNPDWDESVLELSILCGGNHQLPIAVKIFDYESDGKHDLMGEFETSVAGLLAASKSGSAIPLKKKGKDTGTIMVSKAEVSGIESVTERMAQTSISSAPTPSPTPKATYLPAGAPSFFDYVAGGCEINVVVAIDFTGSNGDPRKPGTLHHFNSDGSLNDYEKAITSIVGILEKYDTDKKFPVLGFGAKYDGVVRHAFQCGPTEEVQGVKGVLDAYHQVFKSGLVMSSPTVFDEVIQTAATRAQSSLKAALQKGGQTYTVLLILSDGAVSDVEMAAATLKQVSGTPLSIVIMGVGGADFSSMQFLDDASKPGERDVAQFVAFNQYASSSSALSSATLKEVPDQLAGFFQSKGIKPNAAVEAGEDEIVVEAEEEEIDLSLDLSEDEIVVSGGGNVRSAW
jgi:hypothetical protein